MHSFPTADAVTSYLEGFRVFLEMYPVVHVEQFIATMSCLSLEFFIQHASEVFLLNSASCDKSPLIAALINFVLCLGAHYSENYSEQLSTIVYDNGNKYFLLSDLSYSSVKALVVFISVYAFEDWR